MLNRNVNPAELSFERFTQLMKAKAELTIEHAVAGIECHVEQLNNEVFSDRPTYGCNISERVDRHNQIKSILTYTPEWGGDETHHVLAKISHARKAVNRMLIGVNKQLAEYRNHPNRTAALSTRMLDDDQPRSLWELTLQESSKELGHILDNLVNGPEDPDYADIV